MTLTTRPSTIIRNLSHLQKTNYPVYSQSNLKIAPLLPNKIDDFDTFKKIITNESIIFTSSQIARNFDMESIRRKCNFMGIKLALFDDGDPEILLSEEVIADHRRGNSPTQIELNKFFTSPDNHKKLREVYETITGRINETGLGYYKFENSENELIGGGALAPISEDAKKVDIALHILRPGQGIGTACLKKLLNMAFEEKGVDEVWGSSIIQHPGTPTLCAAHGMIIINKDDKKFYYIDRDMREASVGKFEKVRKNPISAATTLGKGGSNNNDRGGRY